VNDRLILDYWVQQFLIGEYTGTEYIWGAYRNEDLEQFTFIKTDTAYAYDFRANNFGVAIDDIDHRAYMFADKHKNVDGVFALKVDVDTKQVLGFVKLTELSKNPKDIVVALNSNGMIFGYIEFKHILLL
jgi:hypothetical protein